MPARLVPGSSRPAPASRTDGGASTVDQFETAFRELQGVVEQLEVGGLGLDASLALYERGLALAGTCEEIVRLAELRVTHLTDQEGSDSGVAFEPEETDELAF